MKINPTHPWKVTYHQAVAFQERLRQQLVTTGKLPPLHLVAGTDVAYSQKSGKVYAAVVVMHFPGLEVVEVARAQGKAQFPYVPGLLTFREGPVVLRAFRQLKATPDVVIFDGQGYAHPRRMGLASHMGVLLGVPTVGCAKSRLIGEYREPGREAGSWSALRDGGETVGRVLRTRTGVKPVFVSVGTGLSLAEAMRLALRCVRGVRLPEPTRRAHIEVTKMYHANEDGSR